MEKIDGVGLNLIDKNIQNLQRIFPEVFTGEKINFELLKCILGDVIDSSNEKYSLNWFGKNDSIKNANKPSASTLLFDENKSFDWNNSKNIYIEGDNLEALKVLTKTYYSGIQMIYIDPPYNTGNDFIYEDDFNDTINNYKNESNQSQRANPETSGRFHTKWLNMIYPRLKVAKELLDDKGIIFISIGQDELSNLIFICDEIFGSFNRIGIISRMMKSGGGKGQFLSPNIDYILAYAKDVEKCNKFVGPTSKKMLDSYFTKVENEGPRKGELYGEERIYVAGLSIRPNQRYYIKCPDGSYVIPEGNTFPEKVEEGVIVKPIDGDGVWKWTYDTYKKQFDLGNISFKETTSSPLITSDGKKSKYNLYNKVWLSDKEGSLPSDFIGEYENRQSAKELEKLGIPFDFAKPVSLLKYLIKIINREKNITILDFFSGSATTAEAIMQINAEDNGNRRFIMIQLPEKCNENSDAFKAGFSNICDIGEERIRRAAKKIADEYRSKQGEGLFASEDFKFDIDLGFKVFILESSNIKAWDPSIKLDENTIFSEQETIKEDRSNLDVAYEIMLKYGVFNMPLEEVTINNKPMFNVGKGFLIIDLNNEITLQDVEAIGKEKPHCVVFKESGFGTNDNVKLNAVKTLETFGVQDIKCL